MKTVKTTVFNSKYVWHTTAFNGCLSFSFQYASIETPCNLRGLSGCGYFYTTSKGQRSNFKYKMSGIFYTKKYFMAEETLSKITR